MNIATIPEAVGQHLKQDTSGHLEKKHRVKNCFFFLLYTFIQFYSAISRERIQGIKHRRFILGNDDILYILLII